MFAEDITILQNINPALASRELIAELVEWPRPAEQKILVRR